MADLSRYSDEELERIAGGQPATKPQVIRQPRQKRLEGMSDEELLSIANRGTQPRAQESMGDRALRTVAEIGSAIDSVTGAPVRAGIGAFQKGATIGESFQEAFKQFAEDPSKAPSGAEIARRAGVDPKTKFDVTDWVGSFGIPREKDEEPIELSLDQIVGFAIDVAADPTNVIPGTAMAKFAGKAAKAGAKGGAKLARVAVPRAAQRSIAEVTESIGKLWNPKIAPDFDELKQIADRAGVTGELPESVEFGRRSFLGRAAEAKRAGPAGEVAVQRFEDTLRQIDDAAERKITEIGGGTNLTKVEAGNHLKEAYDRAAEKLFNSIDESYDTVVRDFPDLKISDFRRADIPGPTPRAKLDSALKELEDFAKGRIERGVTELNRSQGRGLLNSVEAIRRTDGSFAQTVEVLRDVGEAAFKSDNPLIVNPPDVRRMRKLYGDLSEALIETVRRDVADGQAIAGAVQINNKRMTDFFGEKSVIAGKLGKKDIGPEKVFDALVLNDTRKIEALQNILSPQDMQVVKASALKAFKDQSNNSYANLANILRRKQPVVEKLLTKEELADFGDLVRLGERMGPVVVPPPAAGMSGAFLGIPEAAGRAVKADIVTEALKRRARGIRPPVAPPPPPMLDEITKRSLIDAAAKAAQVWSVQEREQRETAIQRRIREGR